MVGYISGIQKTGSVPIVVEKLGREEATWET
jgi:hypothetical protein